MFYINDHHCLIKILIILTTIYVLQSNHIFQEEIIKFQCKTLDINFQTIIRHVKKNIIRDMIILYCKKKNEIK